MTGGNNQERFNRVGHFWLLGQSFSTLICIVMRAAGLQNRSGHRAGLVYGFRNGLKAQYNLAHGNAMGI